jgi:hypothetical protein
MSRSLPPNLDQAIAAAAAELRQQGEACGCTAEIEGDFAQVDGSFRLEPLVRAIAEALHARVTTEG